MLRFQPVYNLQICQMRVAVMRSRTANMRIAAASHPLADITAEGQAGPTSSWSTSALHE